MIGLEPMISGGFSYQNKSEKSYSKHAVSIGPEKDASVMKTKNNSSKTKKEYPQHPKNVS